MLMWNLLRTWALGTSKKGKRKAIGKYFSNGKYGEWTFQTKEGKNLLKHTETNIKRHNLVKGDGSPYNGNWTYWSKRKGEYPGTKKSVAKLIKKTKR